MGVVSKGVDVLTFAANVDLIRHCNGLYLKIFGKQTFADESDPYALSEWPYDEGKGCRCVYKAYELCFGYCRVCVSFRSFELYKCPENPRSNKAFFELPSQLQLLQPETFFFFFFPDMLKKLEKVSSRIIPRTNWGHWGGVFKILKDFLVSTAPEERRCDYFEMSKCLEVHSPMGIIGSKTLWKVWARCLSELRLSSLVLN